MRHTSVVCKWLVTVLDQHSELRWMSIKVPHGVEVADMHVVVDGVCTDEVVSELVNIKCRPQK